MIPDRSIEGTRMRTPTELRREATRQQHFLRLPWERFKTLMRDELRFPYTTRVWLLIIWQTKVERPSDWWVNPQTRALKDWEYHHRG